MKRKISVLLFLLFLTLAIINFINVGSAVADNGWDTPNEQPYGHAK